MRSLTVILPAHNAASYLESNVERLLQVLPELTSEFQIVLVDDGSTDSTGDLVQLLGEKYRQVTPVYHGIPQGQAAAIESGLKSVSSEATYLQTSSEIDFDKIRHFLEKGSLPVIEAAPEKLNTQDRLIEKLVQWGVALREYKSRQRQNGGFSTIVDRETNEPASAGDLKLQQIVARERAQQETLESFVQTLSTQNKPKYSSVAEKRLMTLSSRDMARGVTEVV